MVLLLSLVRRIVRRIVADDGVPLFVEEVARFVLVTQRLHGQAEEASAKALSAVTIPTTLHDLLMARLDRWGWRKVPQTGHHEWAGIWLCASPCRCVCRGRDFTPRSAAARRRRTALPAGCRRPGHVRLQACPDPGGGYTSCCGARASATTNGSPRPWRPSSLRWRWGNPSWWPTTTRRQGCVPRRFPIGSELDSRRVSARPMRKRLRISPKDWSC